MDNLQNTIKPTTVETDIQCVICDKKTAVSKNVSGLYECKFCNTQFSISKPKNGRAEDKVVLQDLVKLYNTGMGFIIAYTLKEPGIKRLVKKKSTKKIVRHNINEQSTSRPSMATPDITLNPELIQSIWYYSQNGKITSETIMSGARAFLTNLTFEDETLRAQSIYFPSRLANGINKKELKKIHSKMSSTKDEKIRWEIAEKQITLLHMVVANVKYRSQTDGFSEDFLSYVM